LKLVALVAALVLLNASLTFQNVWPTLAVHWAGELSIELAACLLLLIAMRGWIGPPSRAALRWMAALWVLLVFGHYADVTAPALYGRDVNLYWDLRYMPDVAAMVVRAAPLWLVILVCATAAFILFLLYRLFRWALGCVVEAIDSPGRRRALGAVAAAIATLFAGQRLQPLSAFLPAQPAFATPVTQTYARQTRLVADALTGSRSLAASPIMTSDLARVRGADVFLIFIESYGAIAYERPEIAPRLAAGRAQLDNAIRATHRDVVSAYVESPTFGGSSWLAHLSLMSGVDVRDPETNARLMTQNRDTMVTVFARHGYRTIALMPGLRQRWPEGAFYRFDDIDNADRLAYRGPEFGWFAIPDEFTLARFDVLEASQTSRAPRFVFFPTISTHFPFSPTPPYQPDWPRMLTGKPYDGPDIVRAYAKQPDWMNFAPGYVDAVSYAYATLSGYLHEQADRDIVMILLGDHQPAAAVSGEGAPWDVPVHVIASRRPVLDRLLARGFRAGLTPERPSLARMHELLPVLLDAFGDR
jgi:hypothetical protein